jgi:protein gp37/predicted nucleic acid-binding Zn ribbon protein
MSDLFHPDVPERFVAQVWGTMARADWHTFQVLTKRPERMPGLLRELGLQDPPLPNVWLGTSIENRRFVGRAEHLRRTPAAVRFVSAEPLLGPLRCPRRRWPDGYTGPSLCLIGIDWLIVGGESGPRHRPIDPRWVRDLRDACVCEFCRSEHQRRQDCPLCGEGSGSTRPRFFFKQWGGRTPKAGGRQLDGHTWDELPRPQGSPGDVSQPAAASGDVSSTAAGGSPHAAQSLDVGERDGQLSIARESFPDRAGRKRASGATALSASPRARASRDTSPGFRGRARRDTSSSSFPARESAKLAAATSPIARTTGAGRSPSERKPAGSRAGRRVVRRSEPLAEPAALSSGCGGSAPASTGDTSLFEHEQPGVRELVLEVLSDRQREELLAGGVPDVIDASSSGPLRPEVRMRCREVLVRQYTPAAWRSHVAWHSYWNQHGGYDIDDEHLMAASPPRPRSDHSTVRLTWGQVRKWVREDTTQRQENHANASRDTSRTPGVGARAGLSSRTRHDLDRAAQQLRDRFAYRPSRRAPAAPKWAWTDTAAQGCEVSIREVLADAARASVDVDVVQRRSRAVLEVAHGLLAGDTSLPPASATHATRRPDQLATSGCAWCPKPMPPGVRPEAKFCSKRCRQAASRARLKAQPARSPSPPPETCAWCPKPMPEGLRPEAKFCSKRCRQAASRFDLAVQRALRPAAVAAGPADTSSLELPPAGATRRPPPRRRQVLSDTSRAMRFAYADPPYPGHGGDYPEGEEVDHRELVERLVREFPDGWALSTSAAALQDVLALCPAGVRVCSWHRPVRYTRSRRPLSAWEPLIVFGGRELPTAQTQTIQDALLYRGRFRAFPGAILGMKPPQVAVWMLTQLGARSGDELVDLYPGSGAVGEAWRRYAGVDGRHVADVDEPAARDMSRLTSTAEVLSDASRRSPSSSPARDVVRDASPGPSVREDAENAVAPPMLVDTGGGDVAPAVDAVADASDTTSRTGRRAA